MEVQVEVGNPLDPEQVALSKARRWLRENYPGSKIVIHKREVVFDTTRCEAQIFLDGDSQSNVCTGTVLSLSNSVVNEARAELAAIAICLGELGVEVHFQPPSEASETAAVRRQKVDRNSIMACRDMSQVYYLLKAAGIDSRPLREYAEAVKKQLSPSGKKQRMSIERAADFLFPRGSAPVFAVFPAEKRKETPKTEVKKTESPAFPKITMRRTGQQSQAVMNRLKEAGITPEKLKSAFGERYPTLHLFCIGATQDEIDEILNTQ